MKSTDCSDNVFSLIALVIPAYNPDNRLAELLAHFVSMPFAAIVVVDDGSEECSREVFDAIGKIPEITLLRHAHNQGKGAALKTGISSIIDVPHNISHIVTLDADGQHKAKDVIAIINKCIHEPDSLVLGIRTFSRKVPFRSRFGNLITSQVLYRFNKLDLRDTQTGLRAFPLAFAMQTLSIPANRYEYELECILLAQKTGRHITQHPIDTIYIDGNESSHFRPIKDSLLIYRTFGNYILVSFGSFIIDIALFTLFYHYTQNILWSTYLARSISASTNFYFNKIAVFQSANSGALYREVIGYVLLAIFVAGISGTLVELLTRLTNLHATFCKILVDSFLFVFSFSTQKLLIFRQKA